MRTLTLFILMLLNLPLASAPALAEGDGDAVDLEIVHRIRDQAFFHSKVMDYIHDIADRNGPRVTGSPGYRRAAEAAIAGFNAAGIDRAALETWGTFGRGWEWTRVAVQMNTPQQTTLVALPADFSPGTRGPVVGEVVFAPVRALEANGHLVHEAVSLEQAETHLLGHRPDILILDVRLPDGNGIDFMLEQKAALAESLHWPARLLYLPLRIIHPDFLAADLDLINNAGRLRSPYELDLDITEYRYHPFNQSRLRRSLGFCLSTSRLRRLVFHTFLHEEEMR